MAVMQNFQMQFISFEAVFDTLHDGIKKKMTIFRNLTMILGIDRNIINWQRILSQLTVDGNF